MVGVLVTMFYVYSSPNEPETFPEVTEQVNIPFSGGSAKTAYTNALGLAQSWQNDVQLAATSTVWKNATTEALGQASQWDFSFYSPRHRRMYLTVVAVGQPPLGRAHPFELRRPPPLIAPPTWVVDSDEAISIWANSGGNAFLQAFPENQVEALLRHSVDQNTPVWNIIGTSADQSQLFFLSIDAASGVVLNRN